MIISRDGVGYVGDGDTQLLPHVLPNRVAYVFQSAAAFWHRGCDTAVNY